MNLGENIEAWQRWWIESEIGLDLNDLISARSSYKSILRDLSNLKPDNLAEMLEQLLEEYPEYHGFDFILAEPVHRIARNCLEHGQESVAFHLSEICVRMAPMASYISTLSESHYAMGNIDSALIEINRAIAMEPKNHEFKKIRSVFSNAKNSGGKSE